MLRASPVSLVSIVCTLLMICLSGSASSSWLPETFRSPDPAPPRHHDPAVGAIPLITHQSDRVEGCQSPIRCARPMERPDRDPSSYDHRYAYPPPGTRRTPALASALLFRTDHCTMDG